MGLLYIFVFRVKSNIGLNLPGVYRLIHFYILNIS